MITGSKNGKSSICHYSSFQIAADGRNNKQH